MSNKTWLQWQLERLRGFVRWHLLRPFIFCEACRRYRRFAWVKVAGHAGCFTDASGKLLS